MKRRSRLLDIVALAAAFTAVGTTPAVAQGFPRAFTGLFGGSKADANARQRLDVTMSLSEAYDTDLPLGVGPSLDPSGLPLGGYSTMLIAAADYRWVRPRTQVGATASSAWRYAVPLQRVRTVSHSVGVGMSARLPGRASFEMNQSAAYSPSYLYQLFPTSTVPSLGDAITAAPDYDLDGSESYSYGTRMTLAHGSERGSRVTATGEFDRTDFQRQTDARPDLTTYGVQGGFSHGLARNAGASVEYRYRTGEFGYDGPTTEHRVAIGLDYSRPLSVSRRAVFRVNVGSSTLDIPESAQRAIVTGRQYRLHGEFAVDYQFKRTWQARTNYRRGIEYAAALGEPVFASGATVGVEGMVGRRASVSAAAGYATGESVLTLNTPTFDTYTGEVSLHYALTRTLAAYTEYLYYFYDFRGNPGLAPGNLSVVERNGVRAGLVLRVPAFRR